ncbi:MAG: KTSC domain-containing protein [Acidobacteria bacterium]|nr:KTSC domain-containing protein [Acidobacteriota bacterium]MCA1608250.1 KTSC domain-containing protein [Acidobacteriota bacterium]
MILEIEFYNGGTYQYFNLPLHEYEVLMSSSLKGRYFSQDIKKDGYRWGKIR